MFAVIFHGVVVELALLLERSVDNLFRLVTHFGSVFVAPQPTFRGVVCQIDALLANFVLRGFIFLWNYVDHLDDVTSFMGDYDGVMPNDRKGGWPRNMVTAVQFPHRLYDRVFT